MPKCRQAHAEEGYDLNPPKISLFDISSLPRSSYNKSSLILKYAKRLARCLY